VSARSVGALSLFPTGLVDEKLDGLKEEQMRLRVREWVKGRPLLVGAVAVHLAALAEPLFVLMSRQRRSRWPAADLQVADVDEWLGLYRNHGRVWEGFVVWVVSRAVGALEGGAICSCGCRVRWRRQ